MRQKIEQIDVNNENLSGEARMVGNSVFSELVSKFKQTAIGSDRFSKTLRRIVDSQGEQIVIDGSEDKWLNPSERSVSDWVLVAAEKAQLELDAQGKGLNESQGAEYLKLDAKANRLENKIKRVNNGKRSIKIFENRVEVEVDETGDKNTRFLDWYNYKGIKRMAPSLGVLAFLSSCNALMSEVPEVAEVLAAPEDVVEDILIEEPAEVVATPTLVPADAAATAESFEATAEAIEAMGSKLVWSKDLGQEFLYRTGRLGFGVELDHALGVDDSIAIEYIEDEEGNFVDGGIWVKEGQVWMEAVLELKNGENGEQLLDFTSPISADGLPVLRSRLNGQNEVVGIEVFDDLGEKHELKPVGDYYAGRGGVLAALIRPNRNKVIVSDEIKAAWEDGWKVSVNEDGKRIVVSETEEVLWQQNEAGEWIFETPKLSLDTQLSNLGLTIDNSVTVVNENAGFSLDLSESVQPVEDSPGVVRLSDGTQLVNHFWSEKCDDIVVGKNSVGEWTVASIVDGQVLKTARISFAANETVVVQQTPQGETVWVNGMSGGVFQGHSLSETIDKEKQQVEYAAMEEAFRKKVNREHGLDLQNWEEVRNWMAGQLRGKIFTFYNGYLDWSGDQQGGMPQGWGNPPKGYPNLGAGVIGFGIGALEKLDEATGKILVNVVFENPAIEGLRGKKVEFNCFYKNSPNGKLKDMCNVIDDRAENSYEVTQHGNDVEHILRHIISGEAPSLFAISARSKKGPDYRDVEKIIVQIDSDNDFEPNNWDPSPMVDLLTNDARYWLSSHPEVFKMMYYVNVENMVRLLEDLGMENEFVGTGINIIDG